MILHIYSKSMETKLVRINNNDVEEESTRERESGMCGRDEGYELKYHQNHTRNDEFIIYADRRRWAKEIREKEIHTYTM